MRYSASNLKKLEAIFKEIDYTVRYEKGNFQSGYCIVESRRVAVINKFFDKEARINVLLDVLNEFEVNVEELSDESADFFTNEVQKHILKLQKAKP